MKNKLRVNMIAIELVFLLIVIGGSALVYRIFAPYYYGNQKSKVIEQAFEDLKYMDMTNLSEEDLEVITSYEEENLTFTVANEDFEAIYTTSKKGDVEDVIHRNIKVYLGSFAKKPVVSSTNSRGPETLRLLGKFSQDRVKYYVCIKENVTKVYSAFSYTEQFLVMVVLFALLVGTIVMYWQSRWIARPIEEMVQVSQRMAEQDFSVRVKEYHRYQEVNSLAHNFNAMADQLEENIDRLKCSRNTLERDNTILQEEKVQRERLGNMRQEFMANLSHELKTPLAVISSQLELLQLMGDKVDQEYYFQSIREEVQKMNDMVEELMSVSSMEHQLTLMERSRLDLSEVLDYLLLKYEALFHQKQIKQTTQVERDCVVLGNRAYLEQAVSNYIMNAFSHTGEGRQIRISLGKEEENVVFRIYNEGEAIPPEQMEKIWDSYYQGKEQSGHVGLGLYIVRSVIRMHDGTCGALNEEHGVTFWFRLPSADSNGQEADESLQV